MHFLRNVVLAVVASVSLTSVALAQRTVQTSSAPVNQGGFWEIGADAGATIGLDDPKTLSISVPVSSVRAGYYFTDVISLEPGFRFNSFTAENSTASSSWTLELGLLYHLSAERTRTQAYLRPLINFFDASGNSDMRTGFGIGAGFKKPAFNNRAVWRAEANIKTFSDPDATNLGLLFGASVYTR